MTILSLEIASWLYYCMAFTFVTVCTVAICKVLFYLDK